MVETDVKWCTFSAWGTPETIGQLLEHNEKSGTILYAEKQMYAPALWNMTYVNVFNTAEEAIINILEYGHKWLYEIRNYWNFPSTEINWDKMSELEDEIINKRNEL